MASACVRAMIMKSLTPAPRSLRYQVVMTCATAGGEDRCDSDKDTNAAYTTKLHNTTNAGRCGPDMTMGNVIVMVTYHNAVFVLLYSVMRWTPR